MSAYNTSVQSSTGFSPFYLMFGRQAKLHVDTIHGSPPTEPLHEHAHSLRSRLGVSYSKVKVHPGTAIYGQNSKYMGRNSREGDLVWLNYPVMARRASWKQHCPWSEPYTVEMKLSTVVYRIQDTRHG